jgi:hypothetical protein
MTRPDRRGLDDERATFSRHYAQAAEQRARLGPGQVLRWTDLSIANARSRSPASIRSPSCDLLGPMASAIWRVASAWPSAPRSDPATGYTVPGPAPTCMISDSLARRTACAWSEPRAGQDRSRPPSCA